jgi:Zn-dependent M28 family amino/carboxypeptidase
MMRRPLTVLIVLLCAGAAGAQSQAPARPVSADFVAPGPVVPLDAHVMQAVGGLRAAAIASHIALLSSPVLEGRGLGSPGLEAAAEYVAAQLALAGIGPVQGAAGTPNPLAPYFHPVAVRRISRASCQVRVESREGDAFTARTFQGGVDAACPEWPPAVHTAPVVFAGYGIRESDPARDDYRGVDARGKAVLIRAGLPPGAEWQRPELRERYAAASGRRRFAAKAQLAAAAGATALIAIEGQAYASTISSGADAPAAVFYTPYEPDDEAGIPVVRISAAAGDAVLASAGLSGASAAGTPSRVLGGMTFTLAFSGDERLVLSRNVMGMIPGSDPGRRDEAVVIGAHMDHLGRSGATVHPGADDNASGTAALLEIAKAFAAGGRAPGRTVIFAFWTGEEEGHLGSGHYVRNPAWPLERTAVYLNLDMIAHPWTATELRTLVTDTRLERGDEFLARTKPADFIELGVADSAPELAPTLVRAARATGLALHLDWTDGKSGGSDYRAFARRGRPFVRFFGNYFDGYHEPTDTIEKLDPGQVLKMARLALASAWLFADR